MNSLKSERISSKFSLKEVSTLHGAPLAQRVEC